MNQTQNEGPKLSDLHVALTKGGVDVDKLGVVTVASEQYYGEIVEVHKEPYHLIRMKDPRRLIRIQQLQPGNFKVDFILIDYDLISGGTVILMPNAVYFLSDLNEESQVRMLTLYMQYLENKVRAKNGPPRIVIPQGGPGLPGLPPGVRPPL